MRVQCGVEWMQGEIESVCDVWVRRKRCWEGLVADVVRKRQGKDAKGGAGRV